MPPEDVKAQFAKRLRELRKKTGYSIPELAKKSGISRQHIRDLELSYPQKRATIVTLKKLAKGLNIRLEDLMKGL